jgi:hypothetical protein
MLKKSFLTALAIIAFGLFSSFGLTVTQPKQSKSHSNKEVSISEKDINEIYYIYTLHNNGCFYLFRVTVVGGILEFWEPMNYTNYIGQTEICMYTEEQMEVMC